MARTIVRGAPILTALWAAVALARGRTAIMISHRLGADRIIAMAGGRIVESGSHEELLARGGEYARLFAAQAQWHR